MNASIIERLFSLSAPWWEFVLRSIVVYSVILIMIRIAGKRTIGQFTPFDLVVILLLGNAVQNSVISDDISLIGGLIIAATLLSLNWTVGFLCAHFPAIDAVIEGRPVILAKDGVVYHRKLKQQSVSEEDFARALRKANCSSYSDIRVATLEISGEITVVMD